MSYRASPLPLEEVVAGRWYFGFDCLACDARFAVYEDESAGMRQLSFAGDGYVQALCPYCSVDGLYTGRELRHYQGT
jgi:hypothetical protein